MPSDTKLQPKTGAKELLLQSFDDYEAKTNFVGFFDLLYKIDRRLQPERYEESADLP
ncbi:MAG: hypothetical protein JWL75_651 [Parcubacteria group bacterium]|nr:hypothetical protein [Parcubacteria group bacterium]